MNSKTRRRRTGLIGSTAVFVMLGAGEPPETPPIRRPAVPVSTAIRTGEDTLPPPLPDERQRPEPAAIATPPGSVLGTPLVPGQVIQPIDLPGALRLAGARDLDIAIAKERVSQ